MGPLSSLLPPLRVSLHRPRAGPWAPNPHAPTGLPLRPAQPYLPAAAVLTPLLPAPLPQPPAGQADVSFLPCTSLLPSRLPAPSLPFPLLSPPPSSLLARHAPTRDRKELGGLWTAATVRTPPMSASEAAGQRPPRPLPSQREDQLTAQGGPGAVSSEIRGPRHDANVSLACKGLQPTLAA